MTSNSERVREPGGPASGRLQLSGFRRGGGRAAPTDAGAAR